MKEYSSLNSAIADLYGSGITVERRSPVSGGDINRAYALELSDGAKLFMKENSRENADFFSCEAEGLAAMRATGAVRAPEALAAGTDGRASFLLLEYIESGRAGRNSSAELGCMLAAMHQTDTGGFVSGGKYGFIHDNYIGAGVQLNGPEETWTEFFVKKRLQPQFDRASYYFDAGDRRKIDGFLSKIDRYLEEPEHPSLLHGDLWAGNYMTDRSGQPWLIDPAVYVGHPEADLAMTELFGGFDRAFYDAYRAAAGIDPGYRDRKDLYNLYHLLNHLNLFGSGYLYSVRSIVNRY